MEQKTTSSLQKPVKFTVFKIVVAILYLLVTAYLVVSLIDVFINPGDNFRAEIALYLTVVLIIFGTLAYAVCMITSLIGLILSALKRKNGCPLSTVIFFAIFTVLPIITEAILISICLISSKL